MNTVEQEDDNGCGVACVAMLAGISYSKARTTIFGSGPPRLTKTKDLHAVLLRLGRKPLSTRRIPMRSTLVEDLDTDALLFAQVANRYTAKHWLVWDHVARTIRDPLLGQYRYRVLGYLPVA